MKMPHILDKIYLKKIPNYEIIKDQEPRVFYKESVRELFGIFRQSSKSWIESIRVVTQPIREDMSKRKSLFNGDLNIKNQDESL